MARLAALGRLLGSPRARSWLALGCLAVLLVAVNLMAARLLRQRFDLTAERVYTLTAATRRTLAHIDEPITLRFYYSHQLGAHVPVYGVYAQRVRQLLDQYVTAAPGKVRLETYDPQPFSPEEDRALAAGLQGVPLEAGGGKVYFGLAGTNSTDDREIIGFFAPARERLLEYDLTRLVHNLAVPKRIAVGLLSTLPLDDDPAAETGGGRPTAVLQQLRQLATVKPLPADLDRIPAGIDVLMLVHPRKLPPRTLFAIDQYVLQGGKALVFVDPYSEFAARSGAGADAAASDLDGLFKAWGVRLVPHMVAADRGAARRVVVPAGQGGGELQYVGWIDLKGNELNRSDPVTAGLQEVAMASAGIVEQLPGATTRFEPLITTSTDAMQIPAAKFAGLPDIVGLLLNFKPANTSYVLAARISGPAATAFPDGPPGPAALPADAPALLRHSARPINAIVVADTDLLDDRFWARSQEFFGRKIVVPVAGNGDFVANAVEALGGGDDLIDLRSRGTAARPFDVVARIRGKADARLAAEQRQLEEKLKTTQAKLSELTGGEPTAAAATALSTDQQKAIQQFRADLLATRRELRGVKEAQRQDIGHLKAVLEFCDIALVPLVVAVAAIVFAALRRRRWRRRPAALG